MSEDGFLTRWSRRKAAAKAEPQPEPAREDERVPEAELKSVVEQTTEEVDLSALPPLDSITPATDITGFLKRGVPEALRTAALRKAWSADPAIRDFIGLSENAWDFNDPAAIPGFGPIDFSPEQVRQMAAQLVGDVRAAAGQAERALDAAGVTLEADPAKAKEELQNTKIEQANLPEDDTVAQQQEPAAPQQSVSDSAGPCGRPRAHGSALPALIITQKIIVSDYGRY